MNIYDKVGKFVFKGRKSPTQNAQWRKHSKDNLSGDNCDTDSFEIDIFEIYKESRTDKLATMFLPNPISVETFKKIDDPINYITLNDDFTTFLAKQKQQKIFDKLLKEVIKEGASCLYALKNGDKWRIRTTTEFKISTGDVSRYIYVAAGYSIRYTTEDQKQHENVTIYYRFDTEKGGAVLVGDIEGTELPDNYVQLEMTEDLKKTIGSDSVVFKQAAFQVFKYREDAESLFHKIELKKDMFNEMAQSLYKEVNVTTTGLIMDSKKFSNGMQGLKDFVATQKQFKNSILKFVYGTGTNQFSQPVDMWNPNPRTELFQKNIEIEKHAFDEDIQMYRTIGSDGKSNNKGNVQEKQYNTPSYNLIFDILKTLDIQLNQWYAWMEEGKTLTFGLALPIKKEVENIFASPEKMKEGNTNESPRSTTEA